MSTVASIDHMEESPSGVIHLRGTLSNGKPWLFYGNADNAHTQALVQRYHREHARPNLEKFSQHIHIHHGGLGKWCMACPTEARHEALEWEVGEKGYRHVIDQLELIANLNHRKNPHLTRVAREDVRFLQGRMRLERNHREVP